MRKKGVVFFVSAALAGGLIGWSSVGKQGQAPAEIKKPAQVSPTPRPKWSNKDFLNHIHERSLRRERLDYNPLTGKLADWTDQEIIEALTASLSDPDVMLADGDGNGLANHLLGEWMRRDFVAALTWFDKLDSRSAKSSLISKIGYLWPADKPEEGFAFVRSHLDLFSGSSHSQMIVDVLGLRAKQGVGAVQGLLKIMREEKIHFEVSQPIKFPVGFDFTALAASDEFTALWDRNGGAMFIRGWSEQDKDAAFDWLLENHGVKSISPNMLLQPMKWLGGRIESLDQAQRAEYVNQKRPGWLQSPGDLGAFTEGITDPAFLDELRAIGVQSIHGGKTHEVMPLLERIEDSAKRLEILETTPLPTASDRPWLPRKFNQVDEVLLRKKLAEWNAPQDRIDAIISRYKP